MATLRTPWSRTMGLRIPVLNAPMGGVAGGRLASAVARAGGLGMIGIGSAGTIALLQRESEIPRRSQLPFGIGLLDWALERETGLLDAAIAAAPVLISVSFGDNWSWIRRVEGVGVVTATQVCSVEEAREAEDAGIQVLVARGSEGGGHGDPLVGTLPLMTAVLDAVSVPVLVAGGIASARGLAAVLAAGASGAWIGTAFSACPEALTSPAARDALLRASETDTVTTSVCDIALGYPWPSRFPERVLRSETLMEWTGREDELRTNAKARAVAANGIERSSERGVHVNAGQGVGELSDIRSVADIMERLRTGAEELLGHWATASADVVDGECQD
jgi:nitronate monooxygenase